MRQRAIRDAGRIDEAVDVAGLKTMLTAIAAAALAGLAGACSTPGGGPDALPDGAAPQFPDAWLTEGSLDDGDADGWLAAFADPTLDALAAEAQANNPDLRAAAAGLDQAVALARQAGASLTPAAAGSAADTGAPNAPSLTAGVQISWEPDLWGRIRAGRDAAVASAEAVEADLRAARQSVAAGVARAYFLGVEARLQAVAAADIVEALTRTAEIVDVQFREGLATAQDTALVRAELAAARERLSAVEGARRDAVRALELLVGRYPGADLNVPDALPPPPPLPPAGIPSALLERRPDIVAAERRVAAAAASLDRARAARLPSVSLTATGGAASNGVADLLDPGNLAWRATSQLLAPLFDGGAGQARVAAAGAALDQAVAGYAGAALTAFAEVERALDRGAVLAEREAALETALREAGEALRIAELRLSEGEVALLDVLSVRQRAIGARTSLLAVRRERLTQFVDLNLALGGDWNTAAATAR